MKIESIDFNLEFSSLLNQIDEMMKAKVEQKLDRIEPEFWNKKQHKLSRDWRFNIVDLGQPIRIVYSEEFNNVESTLTLSFVKIVCGYFNSVIGIGSVSKTHWMWNGNKK